MQYCTVTGRIERHETCQQLIIQKMFKQGQLNLFVEKHVSVAGKNFRQCGVAYAQV